MLNTLSSFELDAYLESVDIFQILSLAIPFQFISYILHSILVSKGRIMATSLCDLFSLFFASFLFFFYFYSKKVYLYESNSLTILALVVTSSLVLRFILLSGLYYRSR